MLQERPRDEGVSLIEVLVSIALVGVVMTAVTSFFLRTVDATNQQRGKQVAVHLADSAVEKVRALKGSGVAEGRLLGAASDVVPAAAAYLTDVEQWNVAASSGILALPTTPEAVSVAGLAYERHFYVGRCWQKRAGGACNPAVSNDTVAFFRVVVAVTWRNKGCTSGSCAYVTSTLISSAADEPVFNSNQIAQAPVITNPGDQVSEVDQAVNQQFAATGGVPPLILAAANLPPGLSIASSGLVTGIPRTVGTYPVTLQATDARGRVGSGSFIWTVVALPQILTPPVQYTGIDTQVQFVIASTGGVGPFTWSATGLPAGLTLDPVTGIVSGRPNAPASAAVTVTLTDSRGAHATVTFQWNVVPPPVITNPGNRSTPKGAAIAPVQLTATGGSGLFSWTASGLPAGLALNTSTGQITGTPTAVGSQQVVLTVTDTVAVQTATATFTWAVTP
jgi:prepilin-type N-terminal cleavage/methylation domain-containing protein